LEEKNIYLTDTVSAKENQISTTNGISDYKIWLVFWSSQSVEDFERDNVNKNDTYIAMWLTKDNFEILNRDFEKQNNMNVSSLKGRMLRVSGNRLDGIIVFELDHETQFFHMTSIYPDRIWICRKYKQHYSKFRFRELLETAIESLSRRDKNTH
jgi:hypothetical protein